MDESIKILLAVMFVFNSILLMLTYSTVRSDKERIKHVSQMNHKRLEFYRKQIRYGEVRLGGYISISIALCLFIIIGR